LIYLYYGHELIDTFANFKDYIKRFCNLTDPPTSDIYQKGYLHEVLAGTPAWYRCDLTPVLLQDVPKQLQLLALLTK
jgi:hypothetical protein